MDNDENDQQIIDQIINFVAGGSGNVSSLFTTMILLIYTHPDVENKLRIEIREHFHSEPDYNFDNIKKMKYLDQIQLETMRLFGPTEGLIERVATQDVHIAGIAVRKGTALNYFQKTNLYDDGLFEEANKFKPERWDRQNPELQNLVGLGFSGGPRNCLGKHLSLIETKLAVIKFVERY